MLGQLVRYWPEAQPLRLGTRVGDHFHFVSLDTTREFFDEHFKVRTSPERAKEKALEHFRDRASQRVAIESLPAVISAYVLPELTYRGDILDTGRLCRDAGVVTGAIVADAIPILRPDFFGGASHATVDAYFRELAQFDALAFISQQTKDDAEKRLRRPPSVFDRAMPLGADGLSASRAPEFRNEQPLPESRRFVMLGSIERRKRVDIAIEAVRLLIERGEDVELVLAGAVPSPWTEVEALLEAAPPWLTYLPSPDDATVVELLGSSLAAVFISDAEGYGLPAVEALWSGCPVIVNKTLPAIAGIGAGGQVRLDEVSPSTVAAAMASILDEGRYRALLADVRALDLPTWNWWADEFATWCTTLGSGVYEPRRRFQGSATRLR